MTTQFSKRWDSSSRNSLDKETGGGPPQGQPPFSERNSGPLPVEEENRSLRKRIAQLEAENERLKASVFLLTERLNLRKTEPRLSMDSLLSASALPPPIPVPPVTSTNPSPNSSSIPPSGPTPNGTRRTSTDLSAIFSKHYSRDSVADEDSGDANGNDILVCRTTLTGHAGAVYALKYSAEGSFLASTSLDRTVRLWNVASGTSNEVGHHSQSGSDLVWLGISKIATSSLDMTVKVWDAIKPNVNSPVHSYSAQGVALSVTALDNHCLIAGTSSGSIHRYDVRAPGTNDLSGTQGDSPVNALCCGEGVVFSGDAKGRLRAWDTRISRPEELYTVDGRRPVSGIAYSSNGYLAVNSYDNALRVFCKGSSELVRLLHTLRGHRSKNWPVRASFSHPGSQANSQLLLATGSSTNSCFLFGHLSGVPPTPPETESITLLQQLQGHLGSVYSCDFSPEDNHLATCSSDGTLKIWWKRW